MQAAPSILKPGDILAGKYRVDRVLGQGGMGIVLQATHVELYEPRAIKVMRTTAMPDAEAAERFAREARAASLLKSEHVARVYDVGRLDDGSPFMVMEYLEGRDLSAMLKAQGALPPHEAVLYVLQASEALAEAHARGIVHRDLKPANLFLTYRTDGSPCVKVLDFGISKVVGATGDYDMTSTHAVLGSPHYMSPEQMHSTRAVDGRADIWSLGVILYQLVCARLPFRGASITEIVAQVLEARPPPPSQVWPGNAALDSVIMRCIERDPSRRFASVAELAQALLPFAPEGSGPLVDRIVRVSNALVRSMTGMPAVRVDQPFSPPSFGPSVTPQAAPWSPATPLSGPHKAPADSGALATPVRLAEPHAPPPSVGSGTGGWGGTGPLAPPKRRPRALLAATFGLAVGAGALIAWTLTKHGSAPPEGASAAPVATASASAPPPATVEPSPSTPPSTSAAAPVTTAIAAPASAIASAAPIDPKVSKPLKPLKDPFGMDRK